MNLATINTKLAWAVLISGLLLVVMAGTLTVMTGATNVLLVAAFGAVAAQAGKVTLRPRTPKTTTASERVKELVAA